MTTGLERRKVRMLVGAAGVVALALIAWLWSAARPYATPQAAAKAYIDSVEERAAGTMTGGLASVSIQGDSAQAVIEWTGERSRRQLVLVSHGSGWGGTGWSVQTSGTAVADR